MLMCSFDALIDVDCSEGVAVIDVDASDGVGVNDGVAVDVVVGVVVEVGRGVDAVNGDVVLSLEFMGGVSFASRLLPIDVCVAKVEEELIDEESVS
jgi:hypothetical protein